MELEGSKVCTGCEILKPFSEYYKDKNCKHGVKPKCKICTELVKKKYKESHQVEIHSYGVEYRREHQDRLALQQNVYRQQNAEMIKASRKAYAETNKEALQQKQSAYARKNRAKINAQTARRFQTNIQARIAHNIRARVYHAVKTQKVHKSNKTLEMIGCSIDELKAHIAHKFQPGMSWENYGDWHIDHIKPVSKFDLTDGRQMQDCFSVKNLQPLWAHDNFTKGSTYIENI